MGNSDGAWVAEGGDSFEKNQTIARVYKTAKYLQTLRKATLQATLSNMIENAMTIEQNAGVITTYSIHYTKLYESITAARLHLIPGE